MLLQLRQYIRVGAAGEGVDFVDDPLKQILGDRLGAMLKRCRDRGHHAVCLQGVDGVFERMGIG